MSYAYHCCPYINRLQARLPNTEGDSGEKLSNVHDSILWLDDTDNSNVNLTLNELAQQFWKQYSQPSDYSEYEAEQISLQTFTNDLLSAIENPTYPWDNLIDDDQHASNVYLQMGQEASRMRPVKCSPQPGPFMPCKDLFDWWTLRFGVWIVFPLALIGNGLVLIVLVFGRRRRRRRKLDVPRFLICNLAAADFFMGIYLGMLALVDASTLGQFRTFAIRWQNSWVCQLTGFTGVLSTELSVYTLAVITLERNYAITHAMHLNKRLSLRAASIVMLFGWCFSLLMALLPLCGISDYRKFAICLPFETDNSIWSLLYVLTLIIFNGFAFLLLMGCYLRMYCAIRGSQAWNSNDTRIAMRMALLVFTDFLCWAPIAFFTITAVFGYHLITLEEAKIFTVFVLPLNACANPFLYAFFTKQFKKECAMLYKRIDTVTAFGQACFSRNETDSDLAVAIVIDCKICNHQNDQLSKQIDRKQSRSSSNDQTLNRLQHKSNENVDESPKVESNPNNSKIENCTCQCHCKEKSVLVTNRMVKSDSAQPDNTKMNPGHLVRQLFSSMSADKGVAPKKIPKQYKNNSIIYQCNYRKNHIHMTLENEMKPVAAKHANVSRFGSDNSMFRNLSRKLDHSSLNESKHITEQDRSNSYLADIGSRSNSSGCASGRSRSNKCAELATIDDVSPLHIEQLSRVASPLESSDHSKGDHTDGDDKVSYLKHNAPNSVTSGIIMLKNKLIRKNNIRKVCQ